MVDYSTKKVSPNLLDEIKQSMKDVRGWGSVEVYIQDHKVVQISSRNIRKTNHKLEK